jgi:hypothetical protein
MAILLQRMLADTPTQQSTKWSRVTDGEWGAGTIASTVAFPLAMLLWCRFVPRKGGACALVADVFGALPSSVEKQRTYTGSILETPAAPQQINYYVESFCILKLLADAGSG